MIEMDPIARRALLRDAFCRGFVDGARSQFKSGRHVVDNALNGEIEKWWRRGFDLGRTRMLSALSVCDEDLRREATQT